jgi:hypothetical protein
LEGKKKAKEDDKAKKTSHWDRKPHDRVNCRDQYDRDQYGYQPYRGAIKMIAITIAIPHTKNARTAIATDSS